MKKILIIEDDLVLNEALAYDLEAEGYCIQACYTAETGLSYLNEVMFDLIILDVNLPKMSGFAFIKEIRKIQPHLAVMFLSACDLDEEILKGYDLGADEYVTKPFSTAILHRKIKVLMKRNNNDDYEDGFLEINFEKCLVKADKEEVHMTATEFKILKYIFENKHTIITRDNIITSLWDMNNNYIDEHTLTVNITRLRKKIENEHHKYIKTVYGLGYIWNGDSYEK